jgi:hypothetical protein
MKDDMQNNKGKGMNRLDRLKKKKRIEKIKNKKRKSGKEVERI